MDKKTLIAKALILAAAALALAHALWIGTVTDDAGIALAYARNLAGGHGLRLTELSPRVEAYSDPLWVLWLALGYALHLGGPLFARVSGAIFAAAAVVLIGFIPSIAEDRDPRPIDALGPLLLALDTTYNFWAGAGLESGLFALALAGAMLLTVRRSPWSAVPAGLLCVIRPEGPLYLLGFALLAPRKRVRWLAVAALPLFFWLAFRHTYYGEWLPNSFYAKRRWNYGGFWYLNDWFLADPWHWALYAAPFALLARRTRRAAIIALPGCAAAVTFILYSKGDWMSEHRFAAHALPAAALAAGLVPTALKEWFGHRNRDLGWVAAMAMLAAALLSARVRSPDRRKNPELPLAYIAESGRWFRAAADRLGLVRPRVAHFDLGGVSMESGGEVIDLAGLADLYIGRVGYESQHAVREYVLGEVKPELINLHGPCRYLRDDPRFTRDYQQIGSGAWGDNYARKALELDGIDERCAPLGAASVKDLVKNGKLISALSQGTAASARDLWLCARNHATALPDARDLAARFAADGLRDSDPARARILLDAAVTLDPNQVTAAKRLLEIRLGRAKPPLRK